MHSRHHSQVLLVRNSFIAHLLIERLHVATDYGHVLLQAIGARNQAVVLLDTLRQLVVLHLHHGATSQDGENHPSTNVIAPPMSAITIDSMRNLPNKTRPLLPYIFSEGHK